MLNMEFQVASAELLMAINKYVSTLNTFNNFGFDALLPPEFFSGSYKLLDYDSEVSAAGVLYQKAFHTSLTEIEHYQEAGTVQYAPLYLIGAHNALTSIMKMVANPDRKALQNIVNLVCQYYNLYNDGQWIIDPPS